MKQILLIISLIICGLTNHIYGQVAIPYYNSFDNPNDTIGWTHYAISGSDDWEIGIPTNYYFSSAYSFPNAWVTDLDNNYAGYSERVLETPFFNLTDTTSDYALSFFQKRHSRSSGAYFYLEYSDDNGSTWQLLDDVNAQKKNWQGSFGFSGNYYSSFQHSAIDLSFIQGQDSVKFRFRFVSNYANGEGWMIDNFSIDEEYFNIYAVQGDSIFVSQHCLDFKVKSTLGFYNQYSDYVYNKTNYYFSADPFLDSLATLIATKSSNINWTVSNWTQNINILPNLNVGYYYIIYEHDALDTLQENVETDNIGYAVLKIDSVFNTPYVEDFENSFEPWKPELSLPGQCLVWQFGEGYRHHLEDAHSGTKAWHTSKSISCSSGTQYVKSNFIDLTTDTGNLVLNLWYKSHIDGNSYSIEYSNDCENYWNNLYTFPACREDDWDFINVSLNSLSSNNNIKFRIKYNASYLKPEGIIFDDVYIGTIKPDLSIERDKSNRFTPTSLNSDTLKYYINNSGLSTTPQTITAFYWSNDSILDGTDVLLGTKQEQSLSDTARVWTSFAYSKPTTSIGKYYIFYILDTANAVAEMREYNNTGYFTIYQESSVTSPYFNDFESQVSGWRHNASLGVDDWQWTTPNGPLLDSTFSGTKAWVTNDTGLVSPMSRMHLYSPVFDLSALTNPVLEFDMKLHSHPSCHCFEGKMNMSYSIDGGSTWVVLDTTTQSYNRWYYPMEYGSGIDKNYYIPNYTEILFDLSERAFTAFNQYNSRDVQRNTRYILDLGFLSGIQNVQFRFNLATLINNSQSPNYPVEGALIDNFTIRESFVDLNVDYKKSLMISSNAQKVKFFMQIKNQGNYISLPSTTNYYVSSDTILDGSDYYLGQVSVPEIRPDMYFYVNQAFNAPGNLSNYQYLLYVLDSSNTNSESNETNNVGYWQLALDSINNYPYFNDFNDTIIDGWHQYSIGPYNTNIGNYRLRNIVAPGEPLYQTAVKSGEWFTERVPSGSWNQPPYFYLETPAFNFSSIDSIFLSFDLMCTGRTSSSDKDGGNFHFSVDGGNTWTVLTSSFGQAYNWYNYSNLNDLDNEPGWSGPPTGYAIAVLDSTTFDASFLKGEANVVFRFKYKSNWEYYGGGTVQGMRVDNFKVEGFTVDYIANDTMVLVNATLTQPDFTINYSVTNSGQTNGRVTTTKFYWSNDSIFDANDSLIHAITESAISSGATYNSSATITYPTPITQTEYYLFYITDGDSNLVETNEFNNHGSYKIAFSSYPNYYANIEWDSINALTSQPSFNVSYSIINSGSSDGVNSSTTFFWSADSIFDAGDQNIHTVNEVPILSGDTLISTISITYPTPITQAIYYLFYSADNNDDIMEINEGDNIGVFKIIFDPLNSISNFPLFGNINMYVDENYLIVMTPTNLSENSFSMKMINANGQIVYYSDIDLYEGRNKFILPNNLSGGIYLICLQNREGILTRKTLIQN